MADYGRGIPEPPMTTGRGSTAFPPSDRQPGYGPGEEYREAFRQPQRRSERGEVWRREEQRRPRRPWYSRKRLLWPLAFLFGLAAMIVAMWWFTPVADPVTGQTRLRGDDLLRFGKQIINPEPSLKQSFMGRSRASILLVGLDHVPQREGELVTHRSDSVIVANTDFDTKQIRMVSLPRDAWVMHYEDGVELGHDKLGHTYANGQEDNLDDPQAGIRRTEQTVEHLLELPIDYYVVIEIEGFQKVIDALGGIEVDVEKRMKYRDRAGKLNIDLQPGLQKLNGEQAMGYARFRKESLGDIARMGRQQKVLRIMLEEMKKPQNLTRLGQLFMIFNDCVKTNLSLDQLLALARNMEDFGSDGLKTMTIENYGPNDRGEYPLTGTPRSHWAQFIPERGVVAARDFLSDLAAPPPLTVDTDGDGIPDAPAEELEGELAHTPREDSGWTN